MKDIRVNEIEMVLDMYNNTKDMFGVRSIAEFCELCLERCEYCGGIGYKDDFGDIYSKYDSQEVHCCESCLGDISAKNDDYNYSKYNGWLDGYIDEHRLELN